MHSLPSRQYYLLQKHNIIAFAFSYCNNQLTCIYLVCRCIPYPHYNFHYTKEVVECAVSSQQLATRSSSSRFDYSTDYSIIRLIALFRLIHSYLYSIYLRVVCGTIFSVKKQKMHSQFLPRVINFQSSPQVMHVFTVKDTWQ